jgi:hypothetical protein
MWIHQRAGQIHTMGGEFTPFSRNSQYLHVNSLQSWWEFTWWEVNIFLMCGKFTGRWPKSLWQWILVQPMWIHMKAGWIHPMRGWIHKGNWEFTWQRDNSSPIVVNSLVAHVNSLGCRTNSYCGRWIPPCLHKFTELACEFIARQLGIHLVAGEFLPYGGEFTGK